MTNEAGAGRSRLDVAAMTQAALGPGSSQNLAALLQYITEAMNAHGCVLWELAPEPGRGFDLAKGRLFVLASHFQTEIQCAKHDLPVAKSITGQVILGKPYVIENNVWMREPQEWDCAFLHECRAMLTVRFILRDGSLGALNLYRTNNVPFTEEDADLVQEINRLLPSLFQAAHDRVGFELSKTVDQTLREAEVAAKGSTLGITQKKAVLNEVCRKVAKTFCCHEVSLYLFDCKEISLYLQDRSKEPVSFKLIGSTIGTKLKKQSYKAAESDGLTGWVLHNKKAVWIFDLAQYDRDRDWISRLYPKLNWNDAANVEILARELFGKPVGQPLPPLCVVAQPIMIGNKVLGVIRCSFAKGPYYFSKRDQDLLALVAAGIGQCWGTWLSRREMNSENECWSNLVESIKKLNDLVQEKLEEDTLDEDLIYREFLDVINKVIPQADLTSVRLIDLGKQALYYKVIRGSAWNQDKEWGRIRDKTTKITPKGTGTKSAAVKLIQDNLDSLLIPDTSQTPFAQEYFPAIKRKIVVPIKDAKKIFGVFDIRSTRDELFPKNAEAVAQLLGRQLGLYHRLMDTIGRLKRDKIQQLQTSADIAHQLKGPIYLAKYRADVITGRMKVVGDESLFRACQILRGLCRKSKSVVDSLKVIEKLARGEAIEPKLGILDYDSTIRMLITASQDAEFMIDPRREIKFIVKRDSFLSMRGRVILVDHDLLEQAVNNIFDNAGKYSFSRSEVSITVGFTNGDFWISVRNRGYTIQPQEVDLCVQREWRGEKARNSTQEGSGIGLWIVSHIMKAHDGFLKIEPTTSDNYTDVRLIFPTRRESRR